MPPTRTPYPAVVPQHQRREAVPGSRIPRDSGNEVAQEAIARFAPVGMAGERASLSLLRAALRSFAPLDFGARTSAVLFAHLYPFEDFLDEGNLPVIDGGIDRSLRAFKLRLGLGLVEDASGKSTQWIPGGSDICRQAIWRWVRVVIEPAKRRRTPILKELGEYCDALKEGGTLAKVAEMRTARKAIEFLYKRLLGLLK